MFSVSRPSILMCILSCSLVSSYLRFSHMVSVMQIKKYIRPEDNLGRIKMSKENSREVFICKISDVSNIGT